MRATLWRRRGSRSRQWGKDKVTVSDRNSKVFIRPIVLHNEQLKKKTKEENLPTTEKGMFCLTAFSTFQSSQCVQIPSTLSGVRSKQTLPHHNPWLFKLNTIAAIFFFLKLLHFRCVRTTYRSCFSPTIYDSSCQV